MYMIMEDMIDAFGFEYSDLNFHGRKLLLRWGDLGHRRQVSWCKAEDIEAADNVLKLGRNWVVYDRFGGDVWSLYVELGVNHAGLEESVVVELEMVISHPEERRFRQFCRIRNEAK